MKEVYKLGIIFLLYLIICIFSIKFYSEGVTFSTEIISTTEDEEGTKVMPNEFRIALYDWCVRNWIFMITVFCILCLLIFLRKLKKINNTPFIFLDAIILLFIFIQIITSWSFYDNPEVLLCNNSVGTENNDWCKFLHDRFYSTKYMNLSILIVGLILSVL